MRLVDLPVGPHDLPGLQLLRGLGPVLLRPVLRHTSKVLSSLVILTLASSTSFVPVQLQNHMIELAFNSRAGAQTLLKLALAYFRFLKCTCVFPLLWEVRAVTEATDVPNRGRANALLHLHNVARASAVGVVRNWCSSQRRGRV